MRRHIIDKLKLEIKDTLKDFLKGEGIELYVAANDNIVKRNPFVELKALDDTFLTGNRLLFEIELILHLLGKPWQCVSLVKGIYYALHPHNITISELTILLMSINVEYIESQIPETEGRCITMRYIAEEKTEIVQ